MKAHPERMFVFQLARELGYTKSRLLREADSREIAEWIAFFRLESKPKEDKSAEEMKAKFASLATPKQMPVTEKKKQHGKGPNSNKNKI